jgi:hypothetical protein
VSKTEEAADLCFKSGNRNMFMSFLSDLAEAFAQQRRLGGKLITVSLYKMPRLMIIASSSHSAIQPFPADFASFDAIALVNSPRLPDFG